MKRSQLRFLSFPVELLAAESSSFEKFSGATIPRRKPPGSEKKISARTTHTFLLTNATLDFVTSMVLASTYGMGIALAAVVLFLWQGAIYLGAGFLAPFLSAELLTEISIIGGILIASSGIGILGLKDCKTLNMLPALLMPVIWFALQGIIGL